MAKKKGMKLIANNKKAFHDYFIEDKMFQKRLLSKFWKSFLKAKIR